MANPLPITLLEDTVLPASGDGAAVDVGALRQVANVRLDVVALSGSLTVHIETSARSDGPWSHVTQRAMTTPGVYDITAGPLQRYVRARWALGSGSTATLGVTGTAHVIYCVPEDIYRFSIRRPALEDIDQEEQLIACIAATDRAAGYVNNAYRLPLKAWGDDLRSAAACLAGAQLLAARGVDPEGPDALVFDREAKALDWLSRLANGRLSPPGMIDQTPETFEGGSVVVSRPKRGW